MAIVINGSGTVTGLSVGGLPDDSVDEGSLANSINTSIAAKLPLSGGSMTGALTVNSGISVDNFNINGTTIGLSSGNMHLDSGHEIWLDSNDGNFRIKKAGTDIGMIQTTNNDLILRSMVSNEDMLFQGNDGGSAITALTLDMSEGGKAIFNSGLAIGGTGAANTLDEYEEGTWTPAIKFGGNAASFATSLNVGFYIKIGHFVHWSFRTTITNKGSSTGNCSVAGLPFACSSTTGNFGGGHIVFSQNWTADAGMSEEHNQCVIDSGSSSIVLRRIATNGGFNSTTNTQFTNSTQIIMKGEYRVA